MAKQIYTWTDERDGSEHRLEIGQDDLTWREYFKDWCEFWCILGGGLLQVIVLAWCFYVLIGTFFPWVG